MVTPRPARTTAVVPSGAVTADGGGPRSGAPNSCTARVGFTEMGEHALPERVWERSLHRLRNRS
ncbi:hypothetical protein HNR68_000163 [Saccharopolyspora hordei]|uniref:Uncharacterized protein n=1 Tax=Saccharopolyspora hordei TaxID=1838 RepID=A0A853AGT6_9PSEU|nr:hypothetical protein [Saccharopolyspora hordei]